MILMAPQLNVRLFKEFQSYYSKYKKSNKCEWCPRYVEANSNYPKNCQLSADQRISNQQVRRENRLAVARISALDWDWVLAVFSKEYRFVHLLAFHFFCAC